MSTSNSNKDDFKYITSTLHAPDFKPPTAELTTVTQQPLVTTSSNSSTTIITAQTAATSVTTNTTSVTNLSNSTTPIANSSSALTTTPKDTKHGLPASSGSSFPTFLSLFATNAVTSSANSSSKTSLPQRSAVTEPTVIVSARISNYKLRMNFTGANKEIKQLDDLLAQLLPTSRFNSEKCASYAIGIGGRVYSHQTVTEKNHDSIELEWSFNAIGDKAIEPITSILKKLELPSDPEAKVPEIRITSIAPKSYYNILPQSAVTIANAINAIDKFVRATTLAVQTILKAEPDDKVLVFQQPVQASITKPGVCSLAGATPSNTSIYVTNYSSISLQ